MPYRNLHTNLTNSLLVGQEFVFAHLVKFEKPINTVGPVASRAANTYKYITDASYDIHWDDGSVDTENNANGVQVYRAKSLLSVSDVSETIEAKASNITINLASSALGTWKGTTLAVTTTTITMTNALADDNFVSAGFIEGDEVLINTDNNTDILVRLERFTNDNKVAYYTLIENGPVTVEETLGSVTFYSKEVTGLTIDKESPYYAKYINREVYVYKAHVDVSTGQIIGEPFLLFKGIVESGKMTDDPTADSKVSWVITSHWGDFVSVTGRLTSDSAHRAITGKGLPDYEALVRPEYGSDLGFMHSEQAINLISTYQVTETRYKVKMKGGFLGIGKKAKLKEYEVEVDREVDLKFNLSANYLPVVYGVQKVDSIPVFVDTELNDPSQVYVAYAICEGEVHSLYDVYFNDQSSICLDEIDNAARSEQTPEGAISVLCRGRMDRGDILGNETPNTINYQYSAPLSTQNGWQGFGSVRYISGEDPRYNEVDPTWLASLDSTPTNFDSAIGVGHETATTFDTPIATKLIFHAGRENQKADTLLQDTAVNVGFKLQNAYFDGTPSDYWGQNHRLLDTAYAVCKYQIAEGETEIPSVDFVVKGRLVECYNYDYAYSQDPTQTNINPTNFNIGDTVTLRKTSDNSSLGTAKIAWIYNIQNENDNTVIRVRLVEAPSFVGSPTQFYIEGGADRIYLTTHDFVYQTTTVDAELLEAATASSNTQGVNVSLTEGGASRIQTLAGSDELRVAILTAFGLYVERLISNTTSNTTPSTTLTDVGSIQGNEGAVTSVAVKNGVQLVAGSAVDDFYNGLKIKVTRTLADGSQYIQERRIVDYIGATKVALVDVDFNPDYLPAAGDAVVISAPGDRRVSTNPVMQLLDYITNKRFGRGLDIDRDINLTTWQETARRCDTRSKIRVTTTAAPTVGDVYKYPAAGRLQFTGTVDAVSSLGGGLYEVVFEDIIGKLGYRWNNWRTYTDGDLMWHAGYAYTKSGTGTQDTAPTGPVSVSLSKVTGAGPTTLSLDLSDYSYEGNPIVKEYAASGFYVNGYELYDSDDVKYWRYLGWETPDQEFVTRHQTNIVINTSNSVFDNINNFLGHFNGILRYNAGRYEIDVKRDKDGYINIGDYIPSHISDEDIIGAINLEDAGARNTFNQVSCDIVDPQNKFESRSVTFLDSTYLKADRNVPKKGTVKTPGITNYFNARLNAKQFLEESRYGLKINFLMPPKGLLLLAGDVIAISNKRLGFIEKPFRITNITIKENALIQINADEHTDKAYIIEGTQTDSGGVRHVSTPPNQLAPGALSSFGVIADPDFSRATDKTYWTWDTTYDSVINISGTGGVTGGRLVVTGDPLFSNAAVPIKTLRTPLYAAATGDSFLMNIRYRTTTPGNAGSIFLLRMYATDESWPNYGSPPDFVIGEGTVWGYLNTTANEWQTVTGTLTMLNKPADQTQLPYIAFQLFIFDFTSGVVEFDFIGANSSLPIAGSVPGGPSVLPPAPPVVGTPPTYSDLYVNADGSWSYNWVKPQDTRKMYIRVPANAVLAGTETYARAFDLAGSVYALSKDGKVLAIARENVVFFFYGTNFSKVKVEILPTIYGNNTPVSIALSYDGLNCVVGYPYADSYGTEDGVVYQIYQSSWYDAEASRWGANRELIASDVRWFLPGNAPTSYDGWGYSVAMSGDGKVIAIGSLASNNYGQVTIMSKYDSWYKSISAVSQVIDPPAGQNISLFGASLALDHYGQKLVVGSSTSPDYSGTINIYSGFKWADHTVLPTPPTIFGAFTADRNELYMEPKVKITKDGSRIFVGFSEERYLSGASISRAATGGIYVFEGPNWDFKKRLSRNTQFDSVGYSFDIDDEGETIFIAIPDYGGTNQSRFYKLSGEDWNVTNYIPYSDFNQIDDPYNGQQIYCDYKGSLCAVGFPKDSFILEEAGSVLLYDTTPWDDDTGIVEDFSIVTKSSEQYIGSL